MSGLTTLSNGSDVIPVIGGGYMGAQLTGFMNQALEDLGLMNQIKSIMIRKTNDLVNPETNAMLRGMYDPLTLSIIISVGEIWDTALAISVKEERKTLSLHGLCHFLFCEVFLHECYHCQSHGAKGNDWIHDGEEKEAEEFAVNWLCDMAKSYNLELPSADDDAYFGEQIKEWYNLVENENEHMIKMHVDMYKYGVVWRDLSQEVDYSTMREYYRIIAVDALDHKAWGYTELVSVVPDKPADAETTKPVVPAPPATPSSPIDDMDDGEPVASFMDDDESKWDVPWDEDEIAQRSPGSRVPTAPDKPAKAVVPMDPQAGPVIPPTISNTEYSVAAKEVVNRLFSHMFEKCGWTGLSWDKALVGSIKEPVLVDDVTHINQVFMAMNGETEGKFRRNIKITDRIIGDTQRNGTPKYELFMNNYGQRVKRVLVPANIAVQSDAAREMREGKQIAWFMDGYKPPTEDSIVYRLRFDPATDTEVEWTRWPITK